MSNPEKEYRENFCGRLPCRPGERVLDAGGGIGGNARQLAVQVGEKGRVLGLDISRHMARRARAVATPDGIAMRAVAQNRYAAQLMGVSAQGLSTLTWALATMVGAVAACSWPTSRTCTPTWASSACAPFRPSSWSGPPACSACPTRRGSEPWASR